MEYVTLGLAAILFLGAVIMYVFSRKALVYYTRTLSDRLDEMIAGDKISVF